MPSDAEHRGPGGDRREAQQGEQAEQQRVRRQDRGVAADHVAVLARQHGRDRVRVHEQRERRAERERRVGPVARRTAARDEDAGRRAGRCRRLHLVLRGVEHVAEAELDGDPHDRHHDDQIDQGVLDERDQRRRAQTRGVGERREHRERDEQRQVLHEPVVCADRGRWCRAPPGCRPAASAMYGIVARMPVTATASDSAAGVVAAADEVGRRDVALARARPTTAAA